MNGSGKCEIMHFTGYKIKTHTSIFSFRIQYGVKENHQKGVLICYISIQWLFTHKMLKGKEQLYLVIDKVKRWQMWTGNWHFCQVWLLKTGTAHLDSEHVLCTILAAAHWYCYEIFIFSIERSRIFWLVCTSEGRRLISNTWLNTVDRYRMERQCVTIKTDIYFLWIPNL